MASATRDMRRQRHGEARSRAELSLAVQAREAFWLRQVREGKATSHRPARGIEPAKGPAGRFFRSSSASGTSPLGKSIIQDGKLRMLQERSGKGSSQGGTGAAARSHIEDPPYPPRLVPLFPIGPTHTPVHLPSSRTDPAGLRLLLHGVFPVRDGRPPLRSVIPRPIHLASPKRPSRTAPSSGGRETRTVRRRMHEARRLGLLNRD